MIRPTVVHSGFFASSVTAGLSPDPGETAIEDSSVVGLSGISTTYGMVDTATMMKAVHIFISFVHDAVQAWRRGRGPISQRAILQVCPCRAVLPGAVGDTKAAIRCHRQIKVLHATADRDIDPRANAGIGWFAEQERYRMSPIWRGEFGDAVASSYPRDEGAEGEEGLHDKRLGSPNLYEPSNP